ncbi:MAG: class I SAM-dependent methyltransferase [Balneolaceae bacterium]
MGWIRQMTNWFYNDVVLEIRDIKAMQQIAPLYDGYLPWSGASLRPTTIAYLLNDITIHRRSSIVECGSGLSTLFIATQLERLGRRADFVSIDHDASWHEIIREELERRGVAHRVQLVHAPLKESPYAWKKEGTWYDTTILESETPAEGIDLLFVDGPPANRPGLSHARYPAVPFFQSRLAPESKVVLDDGKRRGETDIATKWSQQLERPFNLDRLSGNIYVSEGNDSDYNI